MRRSKQRGLATLHPGSQEEHGYQIEQAWYRVRHFSHCITDELNVMHDKWARQSMINPSKGQEIVYKELESSFCKAKTSRVSVIWASELGRRARGHLHITILGSVMLLEI